jgi:hypothetical protein
MKPEKLHHAKACFGPKNLCGILRSKSTEASTHVPCVPINICESVTYEDTGRTGPAKTDLRDSNFSYGKGAKFPNVIVLN